MYENNSFHVSDIHWFIKGWLEQAIATTKQEGCNQDREKHQTTHESDWGSIYVIFLLKPNKNKWTMAAVFSVPHFIMIETQIHISCSILIKPKLCSGLKKCRASSQQLFS